MDVAVDHLKVRQSPKIEQSGPRGVPVLAPDPTAGRDGQHSTTTARRFERTADFGCAAAVGSRYLGH